MKKWKVWGSVTAAAFAAMLAATPVYAGESAIPQGIYVGDVSVGGMTEAEAEAALSAYVEQQAGRSVALTVEDKTLTATAQELGFAWTNPDAVKEAASYEVTGNLIQRYMAFKDLEKTPVHIELEAAVDEAQLTAFVKANCEELADGAKNAAITRENGAFVITPGAAGKAVDTAATKAAIDSALAAAPDGDVSVTATVTVKEPDITEEQLAGIGDVLGSFSTDFSSSGAARSKNLATGAAKINGHVLMPGETLSGYECMQPFTIENGYHTAAAYENGQVVDSIGGGVCQIATTLYNAALLSELEITQRQNHSMIVGYVKPSMDAAIAGTYKDIKVTNNYSTPIYVEGLTQGRTLTFTIYGKDTRPSNRKVEYVSETLSVTDPGAPIEQADASMAPGTRKQVQSAHKGLKSCLWKVVTVDGVETERTLLHKDTYNASKAIVLVGPALPETPPQPTGEPSSETPPTEHASSENASAANPSAGEPTSANPVEGENGGPGVTAPALPETPQAAPSASENPSAPSASENPQPQASSDTPAPAPEPVADIPANPAPDAAE